MKWFQGTYYGYTIKMFAQMVTVMVGFLPYSLWKCMPFFKKRNYQQITTYFGCQYIQSNANDSLWCTGTPLPKSDHWEIKSWVYKLVSFFQSKILLLKTRNRPAFIWLLLRIWGCLCKAWCRTWRLVRTQLILAIGVSESARWLSSSSLFLGTRE